MASCFGIKYSSTGSPHSAFAGIISWELMKTVRVVLAFLTLIRRMVLVLIAEFRTTLVLRKACSC